MILLSLPFFGGLFLLPEDDISLSCDINRKKMLAYQNRSIKNWAVEDRPREKLLQHGVRQLSDAELLAIIIGSGNRSASALEISRQLLNDNGNSLHELAKQSINQLIRRKGIGKARAVAILAALELGNRRNRVEPEKKIKIGSSRDVFNIFQPLLGDLSHEEFWMLMLNRANKVIARSRISQGGLSGTVIDTRIILRTAIDHLSSSIIVCHNHPSGNIQPSEADIEITVKIREAARLVDIRLLDHVIIGERSYYSFTDEGIAGLPS